MAIFNMAGYARVGKGSGGGASTNNVWDTKLSIKESILKGDGNLGPGDYDELVKMAQQAATDPSLTASERNTFSAKVEAYKSQKNVSAINQANDISRLGREANDDTYTSVAMFGNDPQKFIESQVASSKAKINALADSANRLAESGADNSQQMEAYQKEVLNLSDLQQAESDINGYKGGGQPGSKMVAYVTTTPDGQINNVQIGRVGSASGYLPTNGLYGGLQIYGKQNSQKGFQLGQELYTPATIADPMNPLGTGALLASDAKMDLGSGMSMPKIGSYKDMDPATTMPQTQIPTGMYGRGSSGTLYKSLPDGTYVKFANTDPSLLGIKDNGDVMNLPRNVEDTVNMRVVSVYDHNDPYGTGGLPSQAQPGGAAPSPAPGQVPPPPQQGAGAPPPPPPSHMSGPGPARTSAPTVRAPSTALGLANDTQGKASGLMIG